MGDIKGRKEAKGNFQIIVSPKKSKKKLQIIMKNILLLKSNTSAITKFLIIGNLLHIYSIKNTYLNGKTVRKS